MLKTYGTDGASINVDLTFPHFTKLLNVRFFARQKSFYGQDRQFQRPFQKTSFKWHILQKLDNYTRDRFYYYWYSNFLTELSNLIFYAQFPWTIKDQWYKAIIETKMQEKILLLLEMKNESFHQLDLDSSTER